jgi:hypothetical protein
MNNVPMLLKQGSILGLPIIVTVSKLTGEILYTSFPGRINVNGHRLIEHKGSRVKVVLEGKENSLIIKISVSQMRLGIWN